MSDKTREVRRMDHDGETGGETGGTGGETGGTGGETVSEIVAPNPCQEPERMIEQLRVQLAGCSAAALGSIHPDQVAQEGDYGWSPAYQDVLDLRRRFEKVLSEAHEKRITQPERGRAEAAERERDEAQTALASLADVVNQELRESGESTTQAKLGDDLRPFIRLLVDAHRRKVRDAERERDEWKKRAETAEAVLVKMQAAVEPVRELRFYCLGSDVSIVNMIHRFNTAIAALRTLETTKRWEE